MVDLVYTDRDGTEQGVIKAYGLDLAYGNEENDFKLTLPAGKQLDMRSFVYLDGTEWGGIVRGGKESTLDETPVYIATGKTWHGMLGSTFICPASGEDYVTISGEANAAIGSVLGRTGLADVFAASADDSGIEVSHQFERFTDCYTGIRKMLNASGAKLKIDKQPGCKPTLYALPISSYVDTDEACRYGSKIEWGTPVNHLICLGKGDLAERTVIHLYADEDGNVSGTQTLFGLDEVQEVYDYGNAEDDELLEEGTKKLKELQEVESSELSLPEGAAFDVDDVVGVVSDSSGMSITASVSKVIVKIGEDGTPLITNKIGEASSSKSSGSAGGSSGGGVSYTAGEGISITGGVISADVTASDLDEKADASHTHSASDVASGTLPIARGGTGGSTSTLARYFIMKDVPLDSGAVSDETLFMFSQIQATTETGSVFKRTGASVWTWIASRIRSAFGFTPSNVLPIDHGGTGAATAAEALGNLGLTATAVELNCCDGVTGNIQTQLNDKASRAHTHEYAGSSSIGGSATSAVKLDSSAGSETNPVYFSDGKPVAVKYALNKTVPSDAVFTDTTYGAASASRAGLMSASDKKKLDGIDDGANAYTLPTASRSTLGGVKTTSTVTSASGYTACPIVSGVPYYKDTNTTYSLSSFGITATSAELNKLDGCTATVAELNCVDGVTSNIQAQLNAKAASQHTHNYAGSSSPGGAATSANKLNANAGDASTPVYFSNGVPAACTSLDLSTTGNAATATKATQDGKGQNIADTYIKALSVSGRVITYTKGDGDTGTITTQDTNTTYSAMTGATSGAAGKSGLVPAPAAGKQASFLRGDGAWAVPTNTVYTHPSYTARTGVPTANQTPAFGGSFSVSQPVSDATGHVTALNTRTVTIPSTVATQSAAGLMSAADKKKLDGIESGSTSITWQDVYPVGAYYFSSVSTSPASLFGGTWAAVTGRFLYMNAGTGTGGSNTHTLTVAQMPSHKHDPTYAITGFCGSGGTWLPEYQSVGGSSNTNTERAYIESAGGGGSHNNMPAYQTVYAWRRTA